MRFEVTGSEEPWKGKIFSVRVNTIHYDDGEEGEREMAVTPGAVAVVAHDGASLYLVRQPREAVGDGALLELPAGKLGEGGEGPLRTAKRELAEGVGKGAPEGGHPPPAWAPPRCRGEGA